MRNPAPGGRFALWVLFTLVAAGVAASGLIYALNAGRRAAVDGATQTGVQCAATVDEYHPSVGRLVLPFSADDGAVNIAAPSDAVAPSVGKARALLDFESAAEVAGMHSCAGFGLATVTLHGADDVPRRDHRLTWVGIAHVGPVACAASAGRAGAARFAAPIDIILVDALQSAWVDAYTTRGSVCGEPPTGPSLRAAHQVVALAFQSDARGGAFYVRYREPICGNAGALRTQGPFPQAVRELDVELPFSGCAGAGASAVVYPDSTNPQTVAAFGPRVVLQT